MKKVKITLEIDVTSEEMELTLKLKPSSVPHPNQYANEVNTVYPKKPLEDFSGRKTIEEKIKSDGLDEDEIIIVDEIAVK